MSLLEPFLNPERILCRSSAPSRKRLLQNVAECLDRNAETADQLFEDLMERERLGSTGIGEGVAIPHCRSATDEIKICLVTTTSPIDYEAIDGAPVDVFIALIVPPQEQNAHLGILAAISEAMIVPENRAALRAAEDSASLLATAQKVFGANAS